MSITGDSAAAAANTPAAQSAAQVGINSPGLANLTAVKASQAIQLNRPIDQSTALSGGPSIGITEAVAIYDTASASDPVATAVIVGAHLGTAAWSLDDDADGKYAIDEATGEITVDDTLAVGADTIIIEVAGVQPAVPALTYVVTVLEYPTIEVELEDGLTADAIAEDLVGQASIAGDWTGTPAWSLTGDDAALFVIDEASGEITVATTVTQGTKNIIVNVAGVDPEPDPEPVAVVVGAGA